MRSLAQCIRWPFLFAERSSPTSWVHTIWNLFNRLEWMWYCITSVFCVQLMQSHSGTVQRQCVIYNFSALNREPYEIELIDASSRRTAQPAQTQSINNLTSLFYGQSCSWVSVCVRGVCALEPFHCLMRSSMRTFRGLTSQRIAHCHLYVHKGAAMPISNEYWTMKKKDVEKRHKIQTEVSAKNTVAQNLTRKK